MTRARCHQRRRNQLGRRNLHPDQFALLVGRRYNRAKKAQNDGGAGTAKLTVAQSEPRLSTTADRMAREHGLSRETVKRAGQFADAIEKVRAIAPTIEQDVAADWVDRNQLGRRNLHPDQFALLVGRRYNRAKKAVGGDRGNQYSVASGNSYHLPSEKTAVRIAADHGLSEKTVRNAGQFADAVERVKAIAPSIEREVATGTAGMLVAVSCTVRCAAITAPGTCGLRGFRRRAL